MALKRSGGVLDQVPDNPKIEQERDDVPAIAANGKEVHRPGDKCKTMIGSKQCSGFLSVTSTFVTEEGIRKRYMQCRQCGKPQPQYVQTIPSQFGSRRRRIK